MEGTSTDVELVVDVEMTVSELVVEELAVDSSVSELAVTVWIVDARDIESVVKDDTREVAEVEMGVEMDMVELEVEVAEIEVGGTSSSTSAV